MSTNLYWEPVMPLRESLPDVLKFILRERYEWPVKVTLTAANKPYLEGLRDAKIEGAARLLELIDQYGTIRLLER